MRRKEKAHSDIGVSSEGGRRLHMYIGDSGVCLWYSVRIRLRVRRTSATLLDSMFEQVVPQKSGKGGTRASVIGPCPQGGGGALASALLCSR